MPRPGSGHTQIASGDALRFPRMGQARRYASTVATLYMITGLPYAGKSTLARSFAARGLSVASFDAVMDAAGLSPESMSADDWDSVYSTTYAQLAALLVSGDAVLDGGTLLRSERDTAREIAASVGAETILIAAEASAAEVRRRWRANGLDAKRGQLPRETLEWALEMFEPPSPEERPLTWRLSDGADLLVKALLEGSLRRTAAGTADSPPPEAASR